MLPSVVLPKKIHTTVVIQCATPEHRKVSSVRCTDATRQEMCYNYVHLQEKKYYGRVVGCASRVTSCVSRGIKLVKDTT